MNVVVLVCDALRADRLGCYGNNKQLTPHMDQIASKGARFSNVFSCINATDPSFTTLFTGKYPLSHGILHHANKVTQEEKSYTSSLTFLPEVLQKNGYATIGIDWLGKWHKRGYDSYGGVAKNHSVQEDTDGSKESDTSKKQKKSQPKRKKSKFSNNLTLLKRRLRWSLTLPTANHNWYYYLSESMRSRIRKKAITKAASQNISLLKSRKNAVLSDGSALADMAISKIQEYVGKKPFFLFVHFWDTHVPYTAPVSITNDLLKKYDYDDTKVSSVTRDLKGTKAGRLIHTTTRGRTPRTLGEITANYDASVKYSDMNIKKISDAIESIGISDETLMIITGDHGESHTEHDIFFDHHGLYDPQLNIPLLIKAPEIPSGKEYDQIVQNFDICPTILDILNIKNYGMKFDGQSLMDIINNQNWARKYAYAEEINCQTKRMIRDDKHKFILSLDDQPCKYCEKYHCETNEFYDMESDPTELNNIHTDPNSAIYLEQLNKYIASLDQPVAGSDASFQDEKEVGEMLKALGYF